MILSFFIIMKKYTIYLTRALLLFYLDKIEQLRDKNFIKVTENFG